MARHSILYFILLSALTDKSQACFCDHYPWTQWSSCSKTCNSGTQTRERWVRSILRPSQFGGQPCTEPLMTFQPCIPSKLCKIEEIDCKNKFHCDS
ncbi:C6, partial [Cervus elaphus hippelaphus]